MPDQQCWRSWIWMVLWRPTRSFRNNTQKRCHFHFRGQTMVEVMKIMATFFKRSCALIAVLSALNAAAGHHSATVPWLHQRFLDTHGQLWVCPLWRPFLLDPGEHRFCLCPPRVCSGGSVVWVMMTSSKRAYAITKFAVPKAPAPASGHCWPVLQLETLKHS